MESHFLQVSKMHNIHYQVVGDVLDPPLILLHGGPGIGCTDNDLRFIKDIRVRAILIDQRGCGKSTPSGSVDNNTTQHLIDDVIAIMDHLSISSASILGGSWGSALAILFSMQYPERVSRLILRGLFLANKESRKIYEDQSSDAYLNLLSYAHGKFEGVAWVYYYDMLTNGSIASQEKFAKLFSEYNLTKITEGKITSLPPDVDINNLICTNRIKLHYMVYDFFIEDNLIWDQLDLLSDTPIVIVHGKNDEVCDPKIVTLFASKLPNAKIHWVEAGHNPKELEIINGVRSVLLQ